MPSNGKDLEAAMMNAMKEQILQKIKGMRCRTHGFPKNVQVHPAGKRWDVKNLCCDTFRDEVLQALPK